MQATVSPIGVTDSMAVQYAADEVDHLVCDYCWLPGDPSICGDPDDGTEPHKEDCGHNTCPMCEAEWDGHECEEEADGRG